MNFISLLLIGDKVLATQQLNKIIINILGTSAWQKHPDFININTQDRHSISIKQIKTLQHLIQKKPSQATAQVAVVYDANKLTIPAQNAMLKILEETPANTQLILTTQNEKNLLPTIISRCNIVHLGHKKIQPTTFSYIEKILQNDLNRFVLIDKIMGEKNSVQRKENINKLINDVYNYFVHKKSKRIEVYKLIKKIDNYQKFNVNQKLLLENFLINLPQN